MKRLTVLASLLIVGALPVLMTQGQAQQNVAEIQKVKDNLYMISGVAETPPPSSRTKGW
jgi:hypothetical protein